MFTFGTDGVSSGLRLVPKKGKRVFVSRHSSKKRVKTKGRQMVMMWPNVNQQV